MFLINSVVVEMKNVSSAIHKNYFVIFYIDVGSVIDIFLKERLIYESKKEFFLYLRINTV